MNLIFPVHSSVCGYTVLHILYILVYIEQFVTDMSTMLSAKYAFTTVYEFVSVHCAILRHKNVA